MDQVVGEFKADRFVSTVFTGMFEAAVTYVII